MRLFRSRIDGLAVVVFLATTCQPRGIAQDSGPSDDKATAMRVKSAIQAMETSFKPPDRFALIIAGGVHDDPRINPLPQCANDARDLEKLFLDPTHGLFPAEDHVKVIQGPNVTHENIIDGFEWLRTRATGDNLAIVFFTGHGAVDSRGIGYWLLANTKIDHLSATAFPSNDVNNWLDSITSTRLLVLIDACNAAATANQTQRSPEAFALSGTKSPVNLDKLFPRFDGRGRVRFTSCDATELSKVIDKEGHPGKGYSVFTWHALQALKGAGDFDGDGVIEMDELWKYLQEKVPVTAAELKGKMTPQRSGNSGAPFLLGINAERLVRLAEENERTRTEREKRAAFFKKAFDDNTLTADEYRETLKYVGGDRQLAGDVEQRIRAEYEAFYNKKIDVVRLRKELVPLRPSTAEAKERERILTEKKEAEEERDKQGERAEKYKEERDEARESYKGAFYLRNDMRGRQHYFLRWKQADGTWTDREDFVFEKYGDDRVHAYKGARQVEVEVDEVAGDDKWTPHKVSCNLRWIRSDDDATADNAWPCCIWLDSDDNKLHVTDIHVDKENGYLLSRRALRIHNGTSSKDSYELRYLNHKGDWEPWNKTELEPNYSMNHYPRGARRIQARLSYWDANHKWVPEKIVELQSTLIDADASLASDDLEKAGIISYELRFENGVEVLAPRKDTSPLKQRGVVTIRNDTGVALHYDLRSLNENKEWGPWEAVALDTGQFHFHWRQGVQVFQVRFDHIAGDGKTDYKMYVLPFEQVWDDRKIEGKDGRAYEFKFDATGKEIDLIRR
jgi:hypothetical protein